MPRLKGQLYLPLGIGDFPLGILVLVLVGILSGFLIATIEDFFSRRKDKKINLLCINARGRGAVDFSKSNYIHYAISPLVD